MTDNENKPAAAPSIDTKELRKLQRLATVAACAGTLSNSREAWEAFNDAIQFLAEQKREDGRQEERNKPHGPHERDEHPNLDVPIDPECSAKLDDLGDDRGQGLADYWKWGFRAGWHYAKVAAPKASAVQEQPHVQLSIGSDIHFMSMMANYGTGFARSEEARIIAHIDAKLTQIQEAADLRYKELAELHEKLLDKLQAEEAPAAQYSQFANSENSSLNSSHERVQPSIADDSEFISMLADIRTGWSGTDEFISHLDAKLTQAREEGFNCMGNSANTWLEEAEKWRARAEKAEALLAAIRAGLEGLDRYDADLERGSGIWGVEDGSFIDRADALALLNLEKPE